MKPNLFIVNRFGKKSIKYLQSFLFISFLFIAHLTSAQVKYITQNGAGIYDGSSWANAIAGYQLFDALANASSDSQFWITAGTYYTKTNGVGYSRSESFLIKSGVSVYGGFAGTETNLNQRNFNANVTILSGNINDLNSRDDNNYHVVLFDNVTSPALIDGVTISNGQADDAATKNTKRGGGIYILGGENNVQVQNCILSNNRAIQGGGMFISGTGSPIIKFCTFTNNSANLGGAVSTIAENASTISPTFSQVFFLNNICTSSGSVAGAFNQTVSGSSNTKYTNCVFANNITTGSNAGGILAVGEIGSCNLEVMNCTFVNNGNQDNEGNALTLIYNVTGFIKNSIFRNNYGSDIDPGYTSSLNFPITNNFIQVGTWGASNSKSDPQFLNTSNITGTDNLLGTIDDGLNLACTSPARNIATSIGAPAIDIVGNVRPQGAGIDIGAYELVPKVLSISIAASQNNICSTASVTFTATPVNAGSNPTYQWKKNGLNVGTNSATYTNNSWLNQDVITCTVTSSNVCLASNMATSNSITAIISDPEKVYVKADATGANNGKSWADAFVSLQSAFTAVALAECNTEIWVAKGVYKPTQNTDNNGSGPTDVHNTFKLPPISVYGGFIGNETIRSQRNPFKNLTILSGDLDNNDINTDGNFINENTTDIQGNNSYNVVHKVGSSTVSVLDGFVITGGNANADNFNADERNRNNKGGGMFINNVGGNFSIANCIFTGNTCSYYGGGMVLLGATITLDNCIFRKNTSRLGGGIYSNSVSLTLNNCLFVDNWSSDGGGAFYGSANTFGTANHCNFYNNSSGTGGGIRLFSNGGYNLKNSILWNNPGGSISTQNAQVAATYCNVEGGYAGTGNINANPLFQSTSDLDGPDNIWATADDGLMLLGNSPSKDVATTSNLFFDIRGVSRPYNSIPDMGAYEYETPILPSISIVASNTYICGSDHVSFTATPANVANLSPTYQWKKNGGNVGTNALTYEGVFNPGDVVICEMSIPTFQTIISNSITLTTPFTNNIIYVDAAAPEGNVGDSWANALNNLQNALNTAAGCNNVTQIWVKTGTYFPSSYAYSAGLTSRDRAFGLRDNLAIYGGFAGTETTLTQRNIPNNPTILSGDIGISGDNTDNCYHVVVSPDNNNTAIVDGFIIKDGNANGSETIDVLGKSVYQYGGGGIFAANSSAQFNNCIIQQNNAYTHGGGVYLDYGSPLLNNTIFTDNHVTTGNGGGVFAYSSSFITSNCVFENNSTGSLGGGLYQLYSNSIIRNSTFYNNTATTDGGGIYHDNSAAPIVNCIVWGNHGGGTQGIKDNYYGPFVSYSIVQGGFGGTENSSSDPLFLNANDVDGADNKWRTADDGLQLACGSSAINTASSIEGLISDILGISRPQDGNPDRGAYEKTNNTATPTVAGNTTIHVGQNTLLTANGCLTGSIKWYSSATATLATSTANPLNILPVSNIYYYVSCTLNSCESSRLLVQITVNPNPCVDNPTLANYTAGSIDVVQSPNVINASNSIETETNITYKATKSVTLLPGFKVSSGAVFKAVIGACN